jgi:hypothetical protein
MPSSGISRRREQPPSDAEHDPLDHEGGIRRPEVVGDEGPDQAGAAHDLDIAVAAVFSLQPLHSPADVGGDQRGASRREIEAGD